MQRPSFPRRLLLGWLAIAAHFGEVQTLVLLGVIYAFVMGPAAVIARAAGRDFLAKRGLWTVGSTWLAADTSAPDLERSKHPF